MPQLQACASSSAFKPGCMQGTEHRLSVSHPPRSRMAAAVLRLRCTTHLHSWPSEAFAWESMSSLMQRSAKRSTLVVTTLAARSGAGVPVSTQCRLLCRRESYHHMCRYFSGFFYHHPLLTDVDYYWRIEPDVHYYCDIDYDPFLFMQQRCGCHQCFSLAAC